MGRVLGTGVLGRREMTTKQESREETSENRNPHQIKKQVVPKDGAG